jgi:hypothetical protein
MIYKIIFIYLRHIQQLYNQNLSEVLYIRYFVASIYELEITLKNITLGQSSIKYY